MGTNRWVAWSWGRGVVVCSLLAAFCAGAVIRAEVGRRKPEVRAPKGMVYSPEGMGGYVAADPTSTAKRSAERGVSPPAPNSGGAAAAGALQDAMDAYASGRFAEAQRLAIGVTSRREQSRIPDNVGRGAVLSHHASRLAVTAELIAAYAMARQRNVEQAREWFGRTRDDAAALPDRGSRARLADGRLRLGQPEPSLEEEAAFQVAVCTGALGEKAEAEHEYAAFMRGYPESPLVSAAAQRGRRLNGGDYPKEIDAAWHYAERTAEARRKVRAREEAMCGPACLAEVFRRSGIQVFRSAAQRSAAVHRLADEAHTSDEGTTMEALAEVARHHGLQATGLSLTEKGLESLNPSPGPSPARTRNGWARAGEGSHSALIAVVAPGHYVLVERAGPRGVTTWDPAEGGSGKAEGGRTTVALAEWQKEWGGSALRVSH